ncbi:MAG: vWA domain-containing protein, partial [Solirubrobacteraceae bacterium]
MSDRRRRSFAAGAAALGLALTIAPAPALAAPAPSISGWLSSAGASPSRTLVLVPPAGATVTAGRVHVSENGQAVARPSVTRVTDAPSGALGVMLVVDVSSPMRGAGLNAAVAAGRQLAAARFPGEMVGLVSAGATATVTLPPTADSSALSQALSGLTAGGNVGDMPSGIAKALSELRAAKVALGAVVVVSDGAAAPHPASTSRSSLLARAAASHTPVVTIGLRDAAGAPSALQALARSLPGQFTATAPSGASGVIGAIQNSLGDDYLVSYRSTAPAGQPVAVTAHIDGLRGTVSASYQTAAAKASTPTDSASSAGAPAQTRPLVPSLRHSTPLSPKPSFAAAAPPPAASGHAAAGSSSGATGAGS